MALTKQDLDAIGGVFDANIEIKLKPLVRDVSGVKADIGLMRQEIAEVKNDVRALREQIQQLTITLDKFLKQLTDFKEEFEIMKGEIRRMKEVIKDKLGVEISGAIW